MIDTTQRWLFRRERYRPAGECINPRLFDVAPIGARQAKEFVTTHHYSRTPPGYDRYSFGLFRAGELTGVAIFSHPTMANHHMTDMFGGGLRQSMELRRFVLLDSVEGNGESFFLNHCFRMLRNVPDLRSGERLRPQGIVAFSDPVPRRGEDGELLTPGHRGIVYQASSAIYMGRATARTLHLWPNGVVVNSRRMQKIRAMEKGWRPAVEEFRSYGADEPWEDRRAWLRFWLDKLTTQVHHPGNHKYAWGMSHAARTRLPASLPYPRQIGFTRPKADRIEGMTNG